jgi:hypothetical protein
MRRRDDRVWLLLANGGRELTIVGRRRDHSRVAAAVEEVHDLLGDVVLIHAEYDPRDVVHTGLQLRSTHFRRGRSHAGGKVEEEGDGGKVSAKSRSREKTTAGGHAT